MSAEQYRSRIAHLTDLLGYLGLKTPMYADWEVVLIFYMAKHRVCIHMLLHGDEVPTSHLETMVYVRRNLRKIKKQYKMLYDAGVTARYEVDVQISAAERDEAMGLYRRIEAALDAEPGRG